MHFSIAILGGDLSSSILTSPTWCNGRVGSVDSKNKDKNKYKDDYEHKAKNIFNFDKIYIVEAYPGQAVEDDGAAAKPAPRELGAKGLLKLCFSVAENTTC
jgi:hypothetical protein